MISIPQPIADWLDGQTGLEFVLTVAAFIGVLWAAWKILKAIFPGLKGFIVFIEALGGLPAFMKTTTQTLDRHEVIVSEVRHEVLPNQGASMRDESRTNGLRIEKIEAKLAKDHVRFAAIETELEYRQRHGLGIPPITQPVPNTVGFPADTSED